MKPPKYRATEHGEQCTVFEWAARHETAWPELKLMFAIPNGGQRHIAVAAKLKKEGVKSGVPDICLPIAMKYNNALYIELKMGRNKPTDNQKLWHKRLKANGNKVEVCYGADQAIHVISDYLGIQKV